MLHSFRASLVPPFLSHSCMVRRCKTSVTAHSRRTPNAAKSDHTTLAHWLARISELRRRLRIVQCTNLMWTDLAVQCATTFLAGLARHGWSLLLLAEGVSISYMAATVRLSHRFIYKWVQRLLREGLEGLGNKPGRHHRMGPPQHALGDQCDTDT